MRRPISVQIFVILIRQSCDGVTYEVIPAMWSDEVVLYEKGCLI